MKKIALMLAVSAAALVGGCDEAVDEAVGGGEIVGVFERIDPTDPDSAWRGAEYIRQARPDGVVCEDVWEFEADGLMDDDGTVILDPITAELGESEADCRPTITSAFAGRPAELALLFEPRASRHGPTLGTVYTLNGRGEWEAYASGVFEDDRIVYRRSDSSEIPDATGKPYDPKWDLPAHQRP